jgi:hypothetical protein
VARLPSGDVDEVNDDVEMDGQAEAKDGGTRRRLAVLAARMRLAPRKRRNDGFDKSRFQRLL